MPMILPAVLTSGPPESPGWMGAVWWMSPVSRSTVPAPASEARIDASEAGDAPDGDRRGAALAARVAEGHDLVPDLRGGRVAEGHGLQPGGADKLEDGDVTGLVVPDDLRRVGVAVPDVGDPDRGGALDDVVVGEDLARRRQHQPGAGRLGLLQAEVGDDVHQAGVGLGGDLRGGQYRGPGRGRRGQHGEEAAEARHDRDAGQGEAVPPAVDRLTGRRHRPRSRRDHRGRRDLRDRATASRAVSARSPCRSADRRSWSWESAPSGRTGLRGLTPIVGPKPARNLDGR